MELIKITPDNEKAKSILKMISLIEERIKTQDKKRMAALIIADYYEIAKELITAILLIDGYKTLSHKDLIDYIQERYPECNAHEISVLDSLRVLRTGWLMRASLWNPLILPEMRVCSSQSSRN